MKIAFLGLGIMGSRMAANLIRAGHPLTVWNRTAVKAKALERAGARPARTPAEAAGGAEVLFTMLADPPAVESAALGHEGFLGSLPRGSLWVDCSTVTPAFSRRMGREAAERGIGFLDAPVSGTLPVAERAELTFLAGGDPGDLERCRPLFSAMGKQVRHVGPVGMGSSLKLANNLLIANAMAAFSEALALGEALGLSRSTLLEALVGAPVTAPFLAGKRQKLETGVFEAEFPLRLMYKDLQLVSDSAYELGVPLPVTHATKELFGMAAAGGLADEDFSAVSEVIMKKRGGTE